MRPTSSITVQAQCETRFCLSINPTAISSSGILIVNWNERRFFYLNSLSFILLTRYIILTFKSDVFKMEKKAWIS